MGGRFGKYGDTKRKAKLRQNAIVKNKADKLKPNSKQRRQQKKKLAQIRTSMARVDFHIGKQQIPVTDFTQKNAAGAEPFSGCF